MTCKDLPDLAVLAVMQDWIHRNQAMRTGITSRELAVELGVLRPIAKAKMRKLWLSAYIDGHLKNDRFWLTRAGLDAIEWDKRGGLAA